jgi:glycosyltransferase involved in cell wall biosynthesis
LNKTDVIIFPSEYLLFKFEQYGLEARSKVFLPLGYEIKEVGTSLENEIFKKTLTFGYIGQIAPHKGVHTLIQAFNSSKLLSERSELHLFGKIDLSNNYSRSLMKLAKKNGSLQFKGTFDHHQIGDVMKGIDVIVVPSECFENRPTVINEAFLYKKPVVASNIGTIPEIVLHEKNGLLFEQGDSKKLASHLARFILEPSLLYRLKSGIEPVKTIEEEVAELENLYKAMIAK